MPATFRYFGTIVYPAGMTFGPRQIIDYEFVWLIEGRAIWICDGVELPLAVGDVALVRPGMRDRFIWDERGPTRHGFFHFDPGPAPDAPSWPLVRRVPPGDMLRPLLQTIVWLCQHEPDGYQDAREHALRTALWMFTSPDIDLGGVGDPPLHAVVVAVLDYLRTRWLQPPLSPVPLGDMAAAVAMSPAHLCRIFQREVGHGPVYVARVLRLSWAAAELTQTDSSIREIGASAGFPDPMHFSRAFRAAYGRSPRHYRSGVDAPPAPMSPMLGRLITRMWRLLDG